MKRLQITPLTRLPQWRVWFAVMRVIDFGGVVEEASGEPAYVVEWPLVFPEGANGWERAEVVNATVDYWMRRCPEVFEGVVVERLMEL